MGNPNLTSTCQNIHEDGTMCPYPWFSQSIDHAEVGEWLCRKCYLEWLKNRPVLELKKLLEQVKDNPIAKRMLKEALS